MRRLLLLLLAFATVLLLPGPIAGADDDVHSDTATTVGPTTVKVDEDSVSLSARVYPRDTVDVWFEFGRTTAFGSVTTSAQARPAPMQNGIPVHGKLKQLPRETEYFVRLVAERDGERVNGATTRFVTAAAPAEQPTAGLEPAPAPAEPAPAPAEPAPAPAAPAEPAPAAQPAAPVTVTAGPTPDPEQGSAVVAAPEGGEVRVKVPGEESFHTLDGSSSVPVGSVVDAREGSIALSSETPAGTQTGEFGGAIFQVVQSGGGNGMTELRLRGGSFAGCRADRRTLATVAGTRRKAVRKLWGKDKGGRFRTRGRDSVATVRGTRWTVADFCDRTVTRVTEGAVLVRDVHTGRKALVRAGGRFVARHR